MRKKFPLRMMLCGVAAGAVNGMFGAGGGMVLIPLISRFGNLEESQLFPSSIAIMLPICLVSLFLTGFYASIPWPDAMPYLIGSGIGGILAGLFGKKIPTVWLHRILGVLILWGGYRYLC